MTLETLLRCFKKIRLAWIKMSQVKAKKKAKVAKNQVKVKNKQRKRRKKAKKEKREEMILIDIIF